VEVALYEQHRYFSMYHCKRGTCRFVSLAPTDTCSVQSGACWNACTSLSLLFSFVSRARSSIKGMCLVDWTEIAESFDVVVAIGLR